jgi:hypothetical protein
MGTEAARTATTPTLEESVPADSFVQEYVLMDDFLLPVDPKSFSFGGEEGFERGYVLFGAFLLPIDPFATETGEGAEEDGSTPSTPVTEENRPTTA